MRILPRLIISLVRDNITHSKPSISRRDSASLPLRLVWKSHWQPEGLLAAELDVVKLRGGSAKKEAEEGAQGGWGV